MGLLTFLAVLVLGFILGGMFVTFLLIEYSETDMSGFIDDMEDMKNASVNNQG